MPGLFSGIYLSLFLSPDRGFSNFLSLFSILLSLPSSSNLHLFLGLEFCLPGSPGFKSVLSGLFSCVYLGLFSGLNVRFTGLWSRLKLPVHRRPASVYGVVAPLAVIATGFLSTVGAYIH